MATNTEKIVIQVQVKGAKEINNLEKNTNKATKATGGFTKSMIKAGAAIGSALIIFRQLNRTIGQGIKTFRDFEFQMAKVKAITGANSAQFKQLNSTAQELGRTTFFTAQQVAELQTNYGKLGFTTEEILNAQKATLDLATATDSDLARAAIVAGSAVRGFGLDASETARVVDVMAVAFTSSALDIEKWQTSMTKVAPIAKSAGFSIEDTAAIMAKLADSGIEASIAGTSLRNILLKMQDPNSELVKSFGKTVHSFDQLLPAMKKFIADGGSLVEVMEVVDLRQSAAFEQMLTSAESTEELRDALLGATGAAADMAFIVGDTMEGGFKRVTSALQGFAIAIMENFGKGIQNALDNTAKWLNKITESSEEIAKLISQIINIIKWLGIYKTAQLALVAAKKASVVAIAAMNLALGTADMQTKRLIVSTRTLTKAMLRNPYVAVGALIVTLGNKLFDLKTNTDEVTAAWKEMTKEIGGEIKVFQFREKMIKQLKDELVTQQDIIRAKQETHKLDKEIEEAEKALDVVRINARKETEEWFDVTDDLKDAYVATQVESHKLHIGVLKRQRDQIKGSIKTANVIIEQDKKQTKAIVDNAKYSSGALELLAENKADFFNKLMNEVVNGTKTMEEAEDEFFEMQVQHIEFLLESEVLSNEERTRLEKELHTLKIKNMEDEEKKRLEQKQFALDTASELSNAIFEIDSNNQQRIQDQDLKMLEERKEAGVITQAEYERQVDEINRQAFQREKNANIAKAIMGTALAIIEASPNLLKMQLAGIAGAAQLAVISAQKYALGGMVQGKSHAQGGEKFAVGGRVVELEGGEAVINKRSTSMYKPLLSSINSMGGGVKFADGGLLNQPAFTQSQFNAIGQAGMMGAISQGSKVVVVESDITDSQNAVSVIQSQAGF